MNSSDNLNIPFFSKKYSLNLGGLDKLGSPEEKLKAVSLWVYKLGLMLDDYIPLQGFSNFERIELALNEYVKLKKELTKLPHI